MDSEDLALVPQHANIRIVLVNTSHPGNIGGVARAMKNMGLTELYLVAPKDFPSERAQWRAANAQDILSSAKVVTSLDEALADCQFIVGTSARGRRIPWPLFNPRQCGDRIVSEASQGTVALLFGREDRGLTNDELHKCHYHVHIPTNPDYSSLNLAMAVQILSYETRMAALNVERGGKQGDGQAPEQDWDMPWADHQAVELFYEHLQRVLEAVNFYEPDNPRQTMTRLRRLFNRNRLDKMELGILRGFLSAVEERLDRKGDE